MLRFVLGFLLGLVILPGGFAAIVLYFYVQPRPVAPTKRAVHASAGAALSGAGVTSVIWRRDNEVLRQTCRDSCDDVEFLDEPARAADVVGAAEPDWRPTLTRFDEPLK